jgi:hypothetical protein
MFISNEIKIGKGLAKLSHRPAILEKRGIDDGCGGNAPAESACRQRGNTLGRPYADDRGRS